MLYIYTAGLKHRSTLRTRCPCSTLLPSRKVPAYLPLLKVLRPARAPSPRHECECDAPPHPHKINNCFGQGGNNSHSFLSGRRLKKRTASGGEVITCSWQYWRTLFVRIIGGGVQSTVIAANLYVHQYSTNSKTKMKTKKLSLTLSVVWQCSSWSSTSIRNS